MNEAAAPDDRLEALHAALSPWLVEREARRVAALRRAGLFTGIGVAVAGAIIAVGLVAGAPGEAALVGGLLAGIGLAAWGSAPVRALSREVKTELNRRIAAHFGLDYATEPAAPARFDAFRRHGLVPHADRRRFEDHFSGVLHGARFELYEAELKQRRRSKRRTYYVTVFRGVLIRIDFPRTVEGVTLVTRDQGWFNGLQAMAKSFGGRELERIGLVDPEFERAFEVYGTDQVMARYLLTPSFMERLLALEARMKGERVRAVFDEALAPGEGEGELLIAAETGNRFEAGSMLKPLDARERVETLYAEIAEIEAVIDTLLGRDHPEPA